MRTFFSYSYNDSELTRFSQEQPLGSGNVVDLSGNRSPYAPEDLLTLWVSQGFRNGFAVGGGARYVGAQFFSPDNVFEVPAFLVFDAMASYDFKAWRFRLNVKNLTDEEYEQGTFASTSVVPADPFAVYGSVEYRY